MKIATRDTRPLVGRAPRVDLLPKEIRAERRVRSTRRAVFGALALVVVVSAVASGQAYLGLLQSESSLAQAQARGRALLGSQSRYASVGAVETRVAAATRAEAAVSGGWIDWRAYVAHIVADLPAGAHLTSFSAAAGTAATATTTGAPPPVVPAPAGTVATVTLGAAVTDLTGVQSWITAMSDLPGYLDASPGSVASDTGQLEVQVVLHLGAKAYSPRPASTPAPTGPAAAVTDAAPLAAPSTAPTPAPTTTTKAGR